MFLLAPLCHYSIIVVYRFAEMYYLSYVLDIITFNEFAPS